MRYDLYSDTLPGLGKMAEECGELLQIIGKLIATGGEWEYPWGSNVHVHDLKTALEEELADVLAIIQYFIDHNDVSAPLISTRAAAKRNRFENRFK